MQCDTFRVYAKAAQLVRGSKNSGQKVRLFEIYQLVHQIAFRALCFVAGLGAVWTIACVLEVRAGAP